MPTNKRNYHILIVDDDTSFHQQIRFAFRRNFEFDGVVGVAELEQKLQSGKQFDLILLDLVLDNKEPDKKIGLELITYLKGQHPDWPVIVITNDQAYETVVKAMKLGADDFLQKEPYAHDEWEKKFREAIEKYTLKEVTRRQQREINDLKAQLKYVNPPENPLLGNSPQMETIRKTLKTVADIPELTVLITGETGVGKSIAARFLHFNSQKRQNKPFEEILISDIPESLLESTLFGAKKGSFTDAKEDIQGRLHLADKGIVFLDEIGDLNKEAQSKLLRFLQTKTIRPIGGRKDIHLDVQIVAATNKILRDEVAKGHFRLDLYQRLKVFPVEIPPLRERRDDILTLLLHFMGLSEISQLDECMDDVTQQLLVRAYDWIGNVRELENTVKSMQVRREIEGLRKINLSCLPEEIRYYRKSASVAVPEMESNNLDSEVVLPTRQGLSYEEQNDYNTLSAIEKNLARFNGKKKDVAQALKMKSSDSLRYRIKTIYENSPHLLDDFPVIREHYARFFKG